MAPEAGDREATLAALAARLDLRRIGTDAHRFGHHWWARGVRPTAETFFEIAARCSVSDAEHDLDELELSDRQSVGGCRWDPTVGDDDLRDRHHDATSRSVPNPRRAPRRGSRRGPLLAAAVVVVGLAMLPAVVLWAVGRSAPAGATMLEQASSADPASLELSPSPQPPGGSASPRAVPPPDRGPAISQWSGTDTQPVESTTRKGSATPTVAPTDPRGSQGPRYWGLPPSDSDGWRRLEFTPPAGTEFTATLLTAGSAPCSWRFTGRNSAEARTTDPTTGEVVVGPGIQKRVNVGINGWSVFIVQAKGERSAGCLLVDYKFQPIESGGEEPSGDPSDAPDGGRNSSGSPVSESPSASRSGSPSSESK